MAYSYKYPRPAVTADCVVITKEDSPMEVNGQDDAAKAQWFPIDVLPELAFDHDEIVSDAIEYFQRKLTFG